MYLAEQISVESDVESCGYILRSGAGGSHTRLIFGIFENYLHQLPQWLHQSAIPPIEFHVNEPYYIPLPPSFVDSCSFGLCHSNWGKMKSPSCFDLRFSNC